MKQKLFAKLAGTIDAYHRCIETGNTYADIHEDTMIRLVNEYMPSGSGIDAGISFDYAKSSAKRLTFAFSYHFMDENGYYDGWESYTLIVTPSLASSFDMRITGRNRNYVKEYFYQIFEFSLNQEVE